MTENEIFVRVVYFIAGLIVGYIWFSLTWLRVK